MSAPTVGVWIKKPKPPIGAEVLHIWIEPLPGCYVAPRCSGAVYRTMIPGITLYILLKKYTKNKNQA